MSNELVRRLRKHLQLQGEYTDKELLDAFEGSFTLERIKARIALENLWQIIKERIIEDIEGIKELMRR